MTNKNTFIMPDGSRMFLDTEGLPVYRIPYPESSHLTSSGVLEFERRKIWFAGYPELMQYSVWVPRCMSDAEVMKLLIEGPEDGAEVEKGFQNIYEQVENEPLLRVSNEARRGLHKRLADLHKAVWFKIMRRER